jgi:hypothetical protein
MNQDNNNFALIDRLASGELDEAARRDLFAWLDREPMHWRRCALALVEARELADALDDWRAEMPPRVIPLTRASARPRLGINAAFALAASLMITFTLGVFARGFWIAPAPLVAQSPSPASHPASVETPLESHRDTVKQSEMRPDKSVATIAAAAPNEVRSDAVSPYLRSQLERRGYQVISRPAQLPVVLPDGRRLMLPVDQLQLNYVGQRTY